MRSGLALRCYASWRNRERRAPQERCVRACVLACAQSVYCSLPGACVSLTTSFFLLHPASHRVLRPSTTRRTRVALIPSARHAHLLRASSASRNTERRACACRPDYLYPRHLRHRRHHPINPIPAGIHIHARKERPTLPPHVALTLHDA